MAEMFFNKFPTIRYSNNVVTDLTRRYTMRSSVFNDPFLFYPYDMTDGVRADQVADGYYQDSRMDWLVYMSNGIIDPYYQWYLQPAQFDAMLKQKYGVNSLDSLTRRVKFYRNNWYNDDPMSEADYLAMIAETPSLVKYWEPYYQDTPAPLYYVRRKNDWIINTNYVVRYRVSGYPKDASNTTIKFVEDELVTIEFKDANNSVGHGQVVTANSTYVTLQHMYGNTVPTTMGSITSNSKLTSEQTGAYVKFTSGTLLHNNIADEEVVYWDPVTIYEYENELNEHNRSIVLLNSAYSSQVVNEIKSFNKKVL